MIEQPIVQASVATDTAVAAAKLAEFTNLSQPGETCCPEGLASKLWRESA